MHAAEENFRRLRLPIMAVHGDMFGDNSLVPAVDVVYSIGLIEHFADLTTAVTAHVKFVKPGGLLVIACPNFLGLTGWYKKCFAPKNYAIHNLDTMRISTWQKFERELGLEVLDKRYLGGLEPTFFRHPERPRLVTPLISFASKVLTLLLDRRAAMFLRNRNWWWWDSYALAIYRTPATPAESPRDPPTWGPPAA